MRPEPYESAPPPLPPRDPRGHKGTFGTVGVIGGCDREGRVMVGAPALAARAALRSGCGLAVVMTPQTILPTVLELCPSATGRGLPTDDHGRFVRHEAAGVIDEVLAGMPRRGLEVRGALVVGPGLGLGLGTGDDVGSIVLRALTQDEIGVVVDADALNALAEIPEFWLDLRAPMVLTPHPGEFRRLAGALQISEDPTDPSTRPDAAGALARRLGAVVVLKGAETVVSDGARAWTCPTADPVLATAGTGDVLSGLIGGLAAQFAQIDVLGIGSNAPPGSGGRSLYDLARAAVSVHAQAGAAWRAANAADRGLLAEELADAIPGVLSGA